MRRLVQLFAPRAFPGADRIVLPVTRRHRCWRWACRPCARRGLDTHTTCSDLGVVLAARRDHRAEDHRSQRWTVLACLALLASLGLTGWVAAHGHPALLIVAFLLALAAPARAAWLDRTPARSRSSR